MSHRSWRDRDTTIADPSGGMQHRLDQDRRACRSDRVAKYNQLLRIEEELDTAAQYAGMSAFYNIKR